MGDLSIQELEDVAAAYDRLLGPALFREWAHRLTTAAEIAPGQRVLDVACGTGVLARVAAESVGTSGSVAGVDINPGMLAVARKAAPDIDWREGSAESLPHEDRAFDAVVSQFGLMFFPDRKTALREMMRVLNPNGRLAVAVFDSLDNIPAYAIMADVFERRAGKEIGDVLRFPFSLGDPEQIASLFADAGVENAEIDSQQGTARFASVREMILADVKGWMPFAQIHLDEHTTDAVVEEAEQVLSRFLTVGGSVEFGVAAHVITATKP